MGHDGRFSNRFRLLWLDAFHRGLPVSERRDAVRKIDYLAFSTGTTYGLFRPARPD